MKTKIYQILVNLGKIVLTIDLLIIISITANSFTIKGKTNYGNRCYIKDNLSFIEKYKYDGMKLIKKELKCNTYYLTYTSDLKNDEIILFLNSLSKLLYENDKNVDLQISILGKEKQIIASVVDYSISYIESDIK